MVHHGVLEALGGGNFFDSISDFARSAYNGVKRAVTTAAPYIVKYGIPVAKALLSAAGDEGMDGAAIEGGKKIKRRKLKQRLH